MNKIIVDKDNYLSLENKTIILENKLNKLEINISGNVIIYERLTNKEKNDLKINIDENSSLKYYRINLLSRKSENIIINSMKNSKIYYEEKILLKDPLTYNFTNNISSSNINNEIKVHVVTEDNGKIDACINSDVVKDTKNNYLNEEIKVLTFNNEENIVRPDLLVNSNDIIANHSATISNIKKSDLYYLQSKGMDEKSAKELIKNGFLYNKKIEENIK